MPGKNPFDTEPEGDMGSEDGYYEDDYLPRVSGTSGGGCGYEEDFKKAISVLEQQHTLGDVVNISSSPRKSDVSDDDTYMKKVNLYRSVASKQSLTRRSIDADLDKLSNSLISSKERWSSQTDVNNDYVELKPDATLDASSKCAESPEQVNVSIRKPAVYSVGSIESIDRHMRCSQSSQSLQSDYLKSGSQRQGSSTSLPPLVNRTYSNTSLQARRFNRSNTSMDSTSSLPEGWERVEGGSGVYYWHIPSGTTQYQHPNLSSNQDLSEKIGCLQISIPETKVLDSDLGSAEHRQHCSADNIPGTYDLPPDQHKVLNLGWMEMDTDTIKGANSSVAINECIRKLSAVMLDPHQMNELIQILAFEGTYLKLLDVRSGSVLFKQNILSIRRWGVGSDDVRDFAYVAKQKQTSTYRCYVLRCHVPASVVALQMKNICAQAALKRKERSMSESKDGSPDDSPASPLTPTVTTPPEHTEQPKRFDTLYLGYIRVEKEKGTEVIHAAIDKLKNSNQTNWESVTMEVHVSTINLMKTSDRTLLAEHRVRFVSFMALGKQEHHLGYIVHGGPRIFYCHVYQSDTSCADMARAIQNACNARYQLLLAKQEEMKKSQKAESPGIFSFLKKLKKKSPEADRRQLATKG